VVLMLGFTPVPREAAWYRQSTLLPAFQNGAAWLAGALPAEVTHYMEAGGKSCLRCIPSPYRRSSRRRGS
jgi:hypothetical protein